MISTIIHIVSTMDLCLSTSAPSSSAVHRPRSGAEFRTERPGLKLPQRQAVLGPHHYFSKWNKLSALKWSEKSHQKQEGHVLNNSQLERSKSCALWTEPRLPWSSCDEDETQDGTVSLRQCRLSFIITHSLLFPLKQSWEKSETFFYSNVS